jgi:hypothetical protein
MTGAKGTNGPAVSPEEVSAALRVAGARFAFTFGSAAAGPSGSSSGCGRHNRSESVLGQPLPLTELVGRRRRRLRIQP